MNAPLPNPPAQPPEGEGIDHVRGYRGQVAYIFGYDIAYDLISEPAELLGQSFGRFSVGSSKRAPREMLFYRPRMITLPPIERTGPHGKVTLHRTVKLFPVGAISINVRVPFEVSDRDELVSYHELQFEAESLHEHVQKLADQIRRELEPCLKGPPAGGQLKNEEAYTVFCLESPLMTVGDRPLSAERWLLQRRREVAALLTQEANPDALSAQETLESTGLYLSYYESDLTVIDWDAAIVIDRSENFEEILHVMELANVQLAELEAYDLILDDSMERAYRDIAGGSQRTRRKRLPELREIRVDMARLSDELSNTTKFFGDWHLSRIYKNLSSRFHLADWQNVVNEKLKTLDSLYQILKQDQTNFWMMTLELAIVLLFIIDLVVLVFTIH